MHISLKDKNKARYWGYTRVVDLISPHGVPFRKWFFTEDNMNEFIAKAKSAGCVIKDMKEV